MQYHSVGDQNNVLRDLTDIKFCQEMALVVSMTRTEYFPCNMCHIVLFCSLVKVWIAIDKKTDYYDNMALKYI